MNIPWSCYDTGVICLLFDTWRNRKIKQQCRNCLYTFVHFLHARQRLKQSNRMHWDVGRCLRNQRFVADDLLLCFAYNCKNTVKFNNHIAFFLFPIYVKKCVGFVQVLNRTWHDNNCNLNVHFNMGAINSQLSTVT